MSIFNAYQNFTVDHITIERKDVFILKKKMYANIFILNVIL